MDTTYQVSDLLTLSPMPFLPYRRLHPVQDRAAIYVQMGLGLDEGACTSLYKH